MNAILPRQEHSETAAPPPQPEEDYYSTLVNVIIEASNDPARLRKLVYAVARSNLKPETIFSNATPNAIDQAKTLFELEQAFQLERAIMRLEHHAAPLSETAHSPADATAPSPSLQTEWGPPLSPPPRPLLPAFDPVEPAEQHSLVSRLIASEPAHWESSLPPQAARKKRPSWLMPPAGVAGGKPTRARRRWAAWASLPVHVHVVAAALIVATVFTGSSVVFQWSRRPAVEIAETKAPAVSVALKGSKIAETVGNAGPKTAGSDQDSAFVPLPRNFGVYAANGGLLTQLDPLPIPISAARLPASAEIAQPSRITLPGDRLSFVVFDRDFANGAPQTVSVRVVGRVSRLVKYVDGRVKVTPYQGGWRVRDKSYEFKATPLEGRDILVIRPDFETVLPAGRYALVLNGRGYDFTVAGPVTAPEQCLEQTEVVNGVVIGDCTNL